MGKIPLKMSSAKCSGTIGWQYISGPVKARPRLGFIQGGNKSEQWFRKILPKHHSDVIMSAKASQITSVSIVCSTVCSGADKKKNTRKLRVTGLWREIHRWPVNSPYKGPLTRKMFSFNDVIVSKLGPGSLIMSSFANFELSLIDQAACLWMRGNCSTIITGLGTIGIKRSVRKS